ncbi:hypothetical protein F5H01DRAFT_79385 [Linnemannia elongata]|nr:hypothetical protein F5H01DRAFT_79385 [Linnemannia elongata]
MRTSSSSSGEVKSSPSRSSFTIAWIPILLLAEWPFVPGVAFVVADAKVVIALAALGGRPGLPGFFLAGAPSSDPFYQVK